MGFELEYRSLPGSREELRLAPIPWDADPLGVEVFQLAFDSPLDSTLERVLGDWLEDLPTTRPTLVWSRIDARRTEDLRALCGLGFYPVETALEAHGDLRELSAPVTDPRARLRAADADDLVALKAIARSAFWADRYHLDPNVEDAKADERYARWIERGLLDGERVYAWIDSNDEKVLGFAHLRATSTSRVDLSLIALDPRYRRRGLGSAMYQAVFNACAEEGFHDFATQISAANVDALNVLARLGCSFDDIQATMHWFSRHAPGRS